jgi:hypothetical protein
MRQKDQPNGSSAANTDEPITSNEPTDETPPEAHEPLRDGEVGVIDTTAPKPEPPGDGTNEVISSNGGVQPGSSGNDE